MHTSFISNTYVSNTLIIVKGNISPLLIATAEYFNNATTKLHVNYSIELDIASLESYEINLFEQGSDSILNNQTIDLTKLPEPTVLLIHNSTSKLMGVSCFFEVDINGLDFR